MTRQTTHSAILLMLVACSAPMLNAAELSPAEQQAGFVQIFDGESLTGWANALDGYTVEDEAITCIAERGGNLFTENVYSDFVLRFEFRLPAGGNNGIGLRVPQDGHPSRDGMEIQVLDSTADRYANLNPYQYHGSVYGIIPAKRGYLKQVGTWNEQEIRLSGSHITVVLNGEVIVDGDLHDATANGAPDGNEHPGARRTDGHLVLCGHGSKVQFRNMRIREIGAESDE